MKNLILQKMIMMKHKLLCSKKEVVNLLRNDRGGFLDMIIENWTSILIGAIVIAGFIALITLAMGKLEDKFIEIFS